MEDRIQQLEFQVDKLIAKVTQLENEHKQTDSKFLNIKKDFTSMEENLTILTDNLTKLSETVINSTKTVRMTKRSSPYEKTSYEQTKKTHNLHSNKQKCASTDDSETALHTEDDMSYQDQGILTDNATYDGIIEPDTDCGNNHNEQNNSAFFSYNIFAEFSSRK
ncbi:hypothetical protein RhiirB3_454374 [Rhizophagus irregularis]|nr:hypothetical protein RhiirB3_454374 [Rhizophagus irregularis]